MNTRCTKCNKYHDFRAIRGARLADRACPPPCGGRLQIVSNVYLRPEEVQFPVGADVDLGDAKTVAAYQNRTGHTFYLQGDTFIPITLIPTVT